MIFSSLLLASLFGILGNIISFFVFLAPIPTFYQIYKNKSTEGFHSVPYSITLFNCMLLVYNSCLKTESGTMLITINSIGCIIETIYIFSFCIYGTNESQKSTLKVFLWFNLVSFGLIVLTTLYAFKDGSERVVVVGWMCAVFSVCVFAAPLSITRSVIETKSVKYVHFLLSFFLTLCALIWSIYGLLMKNYYVVTQNVLGFMFGIAQMILYMIYKERGTQVRPRDDNPSHTMVDFGVMFRVLEIPGMRLMVIMETDEENMVNEDEAGGENNN